MVTKSVAIALLCYYSFIAANYVQYPPNGPGNLNWRYYQPGYNQVPERVRVDVFYETRCRDCIKEFPDFPPLVDLLGPYVDLHMYPYGNAKMHVENGEIVVKCSHGEEECYGDKLHACAMAILRNLSSWLPYNACMMARLSDDVAADVCGKLKNIDSEPIKSCAKSRIGHQLLIYYGNISESYHYNNVPFLLINGQQKPDDISLFTAVCRAFKFSPPDVCRSYI